MGIFIALVALVAVLVVANMLRRELDAMRIEVADLRRRLDVFESRGAVASGAVAATATPAATTATPPAFVSPPPLSTPYDGQTQVSHPATPAAMPAVAAGAGATAQVSRERTVPLWERPEVRAAVVDNLLAIVGGLLVLAGALFFLALAINRGWIGETGRVVIALVSGLGLAGVGVWLGEGVRREHSVRIATVEAERAAAFADARKRKRRKPSEDTLPQLPSASGRWAFGSVHGVLTGVGIAVIFFAAVAGTRIYDVLGAGGLAIALLAGAAGVAVAMRWDNQDLAAFGMVSALLSPVLVDAPADVWTLAFVAVALVASLAIAAREQWLWLITAAVVITGPQLVDFALDGTEWRTQALAALLCWSAIVLLGATAAAALRADGVLRTSLASATALGASIAATTGIEVIDATNNVDRALWLAMLGGLHIVVAALIYQFRADRAQAYAIFLGGLAATLLGAAVVYGFNGAPVTTVLLGEGALFTWLWSRTRDPRAALSGAVFSALGIAHLVIFDAPPEVLLFGAADLRQTLLGLAALTVSSGVIAWALFAAGRARANVPADAHSANVVHVARGAALTCIIAFNAIESVLLVTLLTPDLGSDVAARAHVALAAFWIASGIAMLASSVSRWHRLRGVATFATLLATAGPVWLAFAWSWPGATGFGAAWVDVFASVGVAAFAVAASVVSYKRPGEHIWGVVAWLGAMAALLLWFAAGELPDAFTVGSDVLALAAATAILVGIAVAPLVRRPQLERESNDPWLQWWTAAVWGVSLTAAALVFVTISDAVLSVLTSGSRVEQDAQMALSITWGIAGVVVYAWSASNRFPSGLAQPVRVGALILIGVAVAKVVLIDTSQLDAVFRVLVFVVLGLLLLAGAWTDQRLRRTGP